MKKPIYFIKSFGIVLASIFACFTSNAQITLTESDMAQIGGVYISANDTFPTVTPGSPGAGQTWNLTGINNDFADTAWGLNPSGKPYATDFPGTNLCLLVDATGVTDYTYYTLNSGTCTTLGSALLYNPTDTILLHNNPGSILANLPATYLSTWGGTYRSVEKIGISASDSEEAIFSTSYRDTVDGWGTLETPYGSFNSLRIIELSTQLYDSVYEYGSGSWTFLFATGAGNESENLQWWGSGFGYPLADLILKTPYTDSVIHATYLKSSPLGITELNTNSTGKVYPDPASSEVNIMLKSSAQNGYVKIIDVTGRDVESSVFTNGRVLLNTSSYVNGIYLYLMVDRDGKLLDKGKFSVIH